MHLYQRFSHAQRKVALAFSMVVACSAFLDGFGDGDFNLNDLKNTMEQMQGSKEFADMQKNLGSQFGGMDWGDFGEKTKAVPPPVCAPLKCAAGQKPAENSDHQTWTFGCVWAFKGTMMDMDMLGQKQNVDKCCVERDVCLQTCGTTSEECHHVYLDCTKKVCKGDNDCDISALMTARPLDDPEDDEEEKKDPDAFFPEQGDCDGYRKGQRQACTCVPEEDWQVATESALKAFYKKYNPQKLDESGEIKDLEELWKKWKGKEPQMFQALTMKYRTRAVKKRERPPPGPAPSKPKKNKGKSKEKEKMKKTENKKKNEKKQEKDERPNKQTEKAKKKKKKKKKKGKVEL